MNSTNDSEFTDVLTDAGAVVDELLLSIETADSAQERDLLQKELDELVECDQEAARTYEVHCMLEKELRALFENPCYRAELEVSPLRLFFRRLKAKFWPGAVG